MRSTSRLRIPCFLFSFERWTTFLFVVPFYQKSVVVFTHKNEFYGKKTNEFIFLSCEIYTVFATIRMFCVIQYKTRVVPSHFVIFSVIFSIENDLHHLYWYMVVATIIVLVHNGCNNYCAGMGSK